MDEREKLLQQLDESYEAKKEEFSDVKPYKATTNFNTALNQPQMNVNNVTNVNIQDNNMVNQAMGIDNLLSPSKPDVPQAPITDVPPPIKTPQEPINQIPESQVTSDQNLDVTERFYQEQPIYDMQTEKSVTYISNMEQQPQKKKLTISISKDTQVVLLMVVVIFIFILILPVLSNFINNIKNN